MRWQFWIDVGGTFTDCLARQPDGTLLRHKRLSSGVTKGQIHGGDRDQIIDPLRAGDPAGFWRGARLSLLDVPGGIAAESLVADSLGDRLQLRTPLPAPPPIGAAYELQSTDEAPLAAIRYLFGLPGDVPLPPLDVRLGTTRGTNALLTRRGAPTALITTRGFGDILQIGYQNRPELFELTIKKATPLYQAVVEIDERISVEGHVLKAPDRDVVHRQLDELRQLGIESLAVCLLHADRFAQHEELVADVAGQVGFAEISCSHEVAPVIKIVARGDTTVVDAYLNPVLRQYVANLQAKLARDAESELRMLTSAGGLADVRQFTGKDSLLSGPAGGVVGFSRIAQAAGFTRAIGFDMGGTSTDVSRFEGHIELEYETEKAGVRVVAPMISIETVAAGGGSICSFDGVKLAVGPDSAGADPGPACYGSGGPLAVTDLNFFLGKISPDAFPFALDRRAVQQRLTSLCQEIARATGKRMTPLELATGFLAVANTHMARAIRSISVAKGYDPKDYVLVAFGGAAAQHACAIASLLGMNRILNHPDAGILSAYGAGLADVTRHRVRGVYRPADDVSQSELAALFAEIGTEAMADVLAEGIPQSEIILQRQLDLRYQGTDAPLTLNWDEDCALQERFGNAHQRLYGYQHTRRPLEIVAARVAAVGRSDVPVPRSQRAAVNRRRHATVSVEIYFDGQPQQAAAWQRAELAPGDRIPGPALVLEAMSTTVVDPGWRAEVLTEGELLLERTEAVPAAPRRGHDAATGAADPIQLEIFHHHFAAIAEQMGITLRNTASSVNVKERLDFSCALFTAQGDLVVNAPHIPVHLGAMSETVKHLLAAHRDLRTGDVLVTNDPYRGGSHLPDITVVTPVHDPATAELQFFAASRAHHAEIGGIAPGSMSPFSRNLAEEGVLIRDFFLVREGQSRFEALRSLLGEGPFPSRNVADNLADIAAQVAANQLGVRDLRALVAARQWPVVKAYMGHIQAAAEQKVRQALRAIPDACYHFTDHLDNGAPICVAVTIKGDEAEFNFEGTGPVLQNNLNANRAIVTAAVMYCLRCLVQEAIPLNQGVLAPVRIVVPVCLLNPPAHAEPDLCPAVAGGNVETSQRVVDVVLGALGLAAASQGTMNNILFGDASFGYYETVCGGAGATDKGPGAAAVHTHMTNTRLTDPEILEQRFPVRLESFAIRRDSGGTGRHRGGDGVVRRLRFLRPLKLSLLTQRRGPYPPYGLHGGEPGKVGQNRLIRADGRSEQLDAATHLHVDPDDILEIETPGGGGWGQSHD